MIGIFAYSSSAKATPESIPSLTALDGSVVRESLPLLNDFIAQVRHEGSEPQGIWADGLFAFKVNSTCWGCVPEEMNTAAYSTLWDNYQGLFIHNYLGGDKLYDVEQGSRFGIIYADRIEWFQVMGKNTYEAPQVQEKCKYKGEGPFSVWGSDSQRSFSAKEIVNRHFTMGQWTMQTSVCENGKVGFIVVNTESIEVGVSHELEKDRKFLNAQ